MIECLFNFNCLLSSFSNSSGFLLVGHPLWIKLYFIKMRTNKCNCFLKISWEILYIVQSVNKVISSIKLRSVRCLKWLLGTSSLLDCKSFIISHLIWWESKNMNDDNEEAWSKYITLPHSCWDIKKFSQFWFGLVLWHINHCWQFND